MSADVRRSWRRTRRRRLAARAAEARRPATDGRWRSCGATTGTSRRRGPHRARPRGRLRRRHVPPASSPRTGRRARPRCGSSRPTLDEHGLVQRAHGGRGRHRRHAVPRRLRHRRAQPAGPRHPPGDPPAAVVRRDVTGELQEVLDSTISLRRRRPKPSSSRGCTSRSTGRPTSRTSSRSPPTCSECCATCARRSRTGRRCARPRCASPTSSTSDPPPLPEEEVAEAEELLRWLADEHFTFLGYREYDLVPLRTPMPTTAMQARWR